MFGSGGSVDLGSAHGSIVLDSNIAGAMRQARADFAAGIRGMSADLQRVGSQISSYGATFTQMTAPIAALGAMGAKTFMSYEETLTEIGARTGTVGADLTAIGEFAQAQGARTVFSTQQVLDAFLQMLTAGSTAQEAFAMMPGVLDMAAAGNIDLGRAADYVTNVMSVYGLEMEQSADVVDAFARASASSPSNINEMAEAMQTVGGVAVSMGFDVEETAAVLAIFAQNGKRGSEAGTQLKSMLLNMQRPTEDVQGAWRELGTSLYDTEGNLRDFDTVLGEMKTSLAGMTDREQNDILSTIGGSYGIVGLRALMASEGIEAMIETMDGQASAGEVAAARMETLQQKINSLVGSVQALMIAAFEPLADEMRAVVSGLIDTVNGVTEWVKANPELTAQIMRWGAALVAVGPTLFIVGQGLQVMGVMVGMLAGPVGWLALAIGALVVAFKTNFLGVRDAVVGAVPVVLGQLESLRSWVVTDGFPAVVAFLQGTVLPALVGLRDMLMGLWGQAQPHLMALAAWFTETALPMVVGFLTETVIPGIQVFVSFLVGIWEAVSPSLGHLAHFFTGVLVLAVDLLINLVLPQIMWFAEFLAGIWTLVSPGLLALGRWFLEDIAFAIEFLDTVILPILKGFVDYMIGMWALVSPALDAFKDGFLAVMTWIRDNVINPAIGWIQGLVDKINEALAVFDSAKGMADGVAQMGSNARVIGQGVQENNIGAGQFAGIVGNAIWQEFKPRSFRDSGGMGEAMATYAIGRQAGVEAFVTPQVRGEFMANIDQLIGQLAENSGGGVVFNEGAVVVNANTEAGGRAAAKGFAEQLRDELSRMGG